ncbi:hypothetical protein Pla175_19330 [Pirellulimonas nuda]|uniref:3-keto-alpha-glucoside-1,2-lyase/3-keto-2-hydroxy-glucal hydratase domain-containing protein n=1 Tax=Pirellulimonas nuda TaxID=2528009 RepID=A0A518DAP5_9BACT|nr:DUF1080 domain-containing protein [Pirellulimonas nuda]QDU88555.1 hypothetical protein Pla175_19330 [Pirellulimonas nuda]
MARTRFLGALALLTPLVAAAAENGNPLAGNWAFQLPDRSPLWIAIEGAHDAISVRLLWSVGAPQLVAHPRFANGTLEIPHPIRWKPHGRADHALAISEPIVARMVEGALQLECKVLGPNSGQKKRMRLIGKRIPHHPDRPDRAQVAFEAPISLFNGKDLAGWRLADPSKKNGWRAEGGELVNHTPKTTFDAYGEYGNLITDLEFEDHRLTLEYNVPAGGNSGVYLRGMYEAQVVDRDSQMQGLSGPGAIFGRIQPSHNAAKPGGEWNSYELTLVDRHVTVVLNDQVVIDNQPVEGCTGGGLAADDTLPGPVLLQGDHTSVRYRNIFAERRAPCLLATSPANSP